MNTDRLRRFYLLGILLNLGALVYAVLEGELLFALTFGFVIVYLGVRYRMVSETDTRTETDR